MNSLRLRLTLALIAAMAAIGVLAGVAVYLDADEEVNELFDFELRAVAQSLGEHPLAASIKRSPDRIPDDDIVVQIWSPAGARLYCSNAALAAPRPSAPGYATLGAGTNAGPVRSYAYNTDDGLVQVAQSLRTQREFAGELALRLLLPFFIALPLLAVTIGWLVRRSLLPVRQLGRSLAERTDDALDPVPTGDLPDELQPLVTGFNRLLQRLAEAFAAQRALVADAAHELRTPLAAVRLQAQALERCAEGIERDEAMSALSLGIDRATRLVQQLLTLARQEPGAAIPVAERLRFDTLLREVLADLAPLAESRHIELVLEADTAVELNGDRAGLTALAGNLVDNALRYTPASGAVTVRLERDPAALHLSVTDTGPGIPAEQQDQVFERFYRIAGSAGTGSGLGLAIVAAVVDRYGGAIRLNNVSSGGLRVEVMLPTGWESGR